MKKFYLFFAFVFFPLFVFGQNTSVTATLTDSDGSIWANGTYTITFDNPSQGQPPVYISTGQKIQTIFTGSMNGSGALSVSLADNFQVTPRGTWDFKLCSNTSAPCTVITGITITGASMNLSTKLSASLIAPRFNCFTSCYGYSTAEVSTALSGAFFTNITFNSTVQYLNGTWVAPFVSATDTSPQTMAGALNVPTINGINDVVLFAGADVGAQINAACAAFANGGTVWIPANVYTFTTPSIISNQCVIRGQGKGATILHYTATTGTAFTYSTSSNGSTAPVGIHDLSLYGPGGTNTAIGVKSDIQGFEMSGVELGAPGTGFNIGLTFGNNAYLNRFYNNAIWYNGQNLVIPAGLTNAGENISFFHDTFGNGLKTDGISTGVDCVDILSGATASNFELNFEAVSFDGCQVVLGPNSIQTRFSYPHFEDVQSSLDYPFVKMTGIIGEYSQAVMVAPTFLIDASAMTADAFVELNGYSRLSVSGGATSFVYGGTSNPTKAAFYIQGSGVAALTVNGTLNGNDATHFSSPLYATDGVNTPQVINEINQAQATLSIPSTGGTYVINSADGSGNLNGDYIISYLGPNRYDTMRVHVTAGSYSTSDTLNELHRFVYAGNPVLTPVILGNAAAGAQTASQFAVQITNQGGNAGTLYVTWIGGLDQVQSVLFPSVTAFTNVLTTHGVTIDAAGNFSTNGTISESNTGTNAFSGPIQSPHFYSSGVPSISCNNGAGGGAGNGGTCTFAANSTDESGVITVVTGTSPGAGVLVFTVTLANGCTHSVVPITKSANSAAASLTGNTHDFSAGLTVNSWSLSSNSVGLTASTTYMWNYHTRCN